MNAAKVTKPVKIFDLWNDARKTARSLPTTSRILGIIALTLVAIFMTFALSPAQNALMAAGAAVSIAVLGLSWLTGLSGQISVGNSGFVMVGGYAGALWAEHHTKSPVIISLGLATLIGALSGLIIGIPGTRLRGPYLAGFTIAFATVLPQFVSTLSALGGSGAIFVTPLVAPSWFISFVGGQYAQIDGTAQWTTIFVLIVAGIAFFFMGNLMHSKTGRSLRLVRDNDVAAELVGINLPRTRTLAFVISAAYSGLAGGLLILINQSINAQSFPIGFSIILLTVMVLGGIGTLSGAVIAGIIYSFSGILIGHLNSLLHISPASGWYYNMQSILFGLVLIVTMITAPRGLVGLGSTIRRLLRGQRSPRTTA
jgi:branched-chain amino acid transport system permease protein